MKLNGCLIRAHLQTIHRSQDDLAKEVGLGRAHLCRLLGGYHAPRPDIRRAIEGAPMLQPIRGQLWRHP